MGLPDHVFDYITSSQALTFLSRGFHALLIL